MCWAFQGVVDVREFQDAPRAPLCWADVPHFSLSQLHRMAACFALSTAEAPTVMHRRLTSMAWLSDSLFVGYVDVTKTCRAAQGVVEARTLQDAAGRSFTVVLLARRSRLHPGMRYIARGLNALASPGNELECEQLVWTAAAPARGGATLNPDRDGAAPSTSGSGEGKGVGSRDGGEGGDSGAVVRWSSFLWRRGTVPIWWGVELRSGGVGEANIVVSPSRPYRGTRRRACRAQTPASHGVPGRAMLRRVV